MDKVTNETLGHCDVREVQIISGITADDVEIILNMAAASGSFTSDLMMAAEDMAWDSAYGDGNELQTFLKAVVNSSGQLKTVGFTCYGPIPHWPGNYEMYSIAVEPEFQRLGIGSALLSEILRQTAFEGGNRIFLETGTDKAFENARLFYEVNNFVQQHRYIKGFTPNEGGIVYCYDIDPDDVDEQYQ